MGGIPLLKIVGSVDHLPTTLIPLLRISMNMVFMGIETVPFMVHAVRRKFTSLS